MIDRASGSLVVASVILIMAAGCTSEQDRIGKALNRDLADALAGCVSVAWELNAEVPVRRAFCATGHPRLNLPYVLEVLSHTGHVRVAAEKPGAHRFPYAKQYELVGGQPIAKITTRTDTTTLLCWADVRAQVMETGPTEVRDGRLGVDVWFEVEATPPLWAERLGSRERETLQRHTRWAHNLEWPGDNASENRPRRSVRRATYSNGGWTFERITSRQKVTWATSERRTLWGAPKPSTSRPRIARVDRQANRYRLFTNGFEEGDLSAWKTTTP